MRVYTNTNPCEWIALMARIEQEDDGLPDAALSGPASADPQDFPPSPATGGAHGVTRARSDFHGLFRDWWLALSARERLDAQSRR